MIRMAQTNVTVTMLEKFFVIKEASALDIFVETIYTMVFKLLATMSIMVWILDSGAIRHISSDQSRFPDLTDYENFCYTISGEQLTIKGKRNIDLSIRDKVL